MATLRVSDGMRVNKGCAFVGVCVPCFYSPDRWATVDSSNLYCCVLCYLCDSCRVPLIAFAQAVKASLCFKSSQSYFQLSFCLNVLFIGWFFSRCAHHHSVCQPGMQTRWGRAGGDDVWETHHRVSQALWCHVCLHWHGGQDRGSAQSQLIKLLEILQAVLFYGSKSGPVSCRKVHLCVGRQKLSFLVRVLGGCWSFVWL